MAAPIRLSKWFRVYVLASLGFGLTVSVVKIVDSWTQGGYCGCGPGTQCISNQRQISLALSMYMNQHGTYPPGTVPNDALPPAQRLSWLVDVVPYLDMAETVADFDRSKGWDHPANRVTGYVSSLMSCPYDVRSTGPSQGGVTDYVGIAGLGVDSPTLTLPHPRAGVFGYDRKTRPRDFRDGMSSTLLIAETAQAFGPWTAGGPATVRGLDPGRKPYLGPGRQFGGLHPRGVTYVAMADGSTRRIAESIDPKVFEALSTIAGGETLPADW